MSVNLKISMELVYSIFYSRGVDTLSLFLWNALGLAIAGRGEKLHVSLWPLGYPPTWPECRSGPPASQAS